MTRTVLLSGATGFVGKVLLERLLAEREALGIERVIALVRAHDDDAARARLEHEVLSSECFSRLPAEARSPVAAAAFDLTLPELGLSAEARRDILEHVTHVLHGAASVEFELPLREAVQINAEGSLAMLELAEACRHPVVFGLISTAYATPHQTGEIAEDRLAPLPRPARALYEDSRAVGDEARALAETGHPNTYTWSKCLAEHLVAERAERSRVRILRPSIVSACSERPFPGWIDSGAAFAGFVTLLGTGQLRAVCARPDVQLDIVPCDRVCEEAIALCFEDDPSACVIRHAVAGSAGSLPIAMCRREIARFFLRFPVGLGPRIRFVGPDGLRFRIADWLFHEVPFRLRGAFSSLRGDAVRAGAALRSLDRVRQLNRTFHHFTHREFTFRTESARDLGGSRERYLEIVCRGVYRHLLRRDDSECPIAGSEAPRSLPVPIRDRFRVGWLRAALRRVAPLVTYEPGGLEKAVSDLGRAPTVLLTSRTGGCLDVAIVRLLVSLRPELGLLHLREVQDAAGLQAALRAHETPVLAASSDTRAAAETIRVAGSPITVLPIPIHFEHPLPNDAAPLRIRDVFFRAMPRVGRIHARCGAPLTIEGSAEPGTLTARLDQALRRAAPLSSQELRSFVRAQRIDVHPGRLAEALRRRGEQVLRTRSAGNDSDAFPRFLWRLAPTSTRPADGADEDAPELCAFHQALRTGWP